MPTLTSPRQGQPELPAAASSTSSSPSADALARLKAQFAPAPGYLNASTMGLPPEPVVQALRSALEQWQLGRATATGYDADVQAARTAYGRFVGVPAEWVSVGPQASVYAGVVAASLPDGAEVLCVEGDFTSMIFPFLVQAQTGRISVRHVPLGEVAASITERTTLVSFSLAQSACGSLCDGAAIAESARLAGALTFCDVTQAAGWLPFDAGDYDLTVCSAYKWMCQPLGTTYFTVRPGAVSWLRPVVAGWYAGDDIWGSCYGPDMVLSSNASRFDVSPAWLSWVGAVPALEVMSMAPIEAIRDHDVALADGLRERLGLRPEGRPVLRLDDADGSIATRLGDAGVTVSSRAGGVRIAFHVWNTAADVDLVADALGAR
jgi:selenocysteine lyase/cysteine desulfurase